MLKREAREILDLEDDPDLKLVSERTYDICELLLELHDRGELKTDFQAVQDTIAYHAPCQQQGHFIGKPALELLALIPGLQVTEMNARCCGIAGTYGLKAEKYDIAMAVGADLFEQVRASGAATVACDSETCRWQIAKATDRPAVHPIDLLHRAYGLYVVGLVVVSHSAALAEGVVALAREMGGEELKLEAAGGMDEPGALGTDAERVRAAIERAMSDDGVLVLMDLGSALMSAEFAIEMLDGAAGRVLMSDAPLVEGTVAAAVAARGGATLEEVAAEARGALAMKASQLGVEEAPGAAAEEEPAAPADAQERLEVRNAIGLHARPAALFVGVARDYDAEVRVAKAGGGAPVRATSLTNVVALGARFGDTLVVSASGPQAAEALAALRALADEGFGDGIAAAAGAPVRGGARPRRPRRPSPLEVAAAARRATCSPAWRPRPASRWGPRATSAGPTDRRPTARPTRPSASASASTRPSRPPARRSGATARPWPRAPATPRRRSSTPTWPCSTTRRCSTPPTPPSRRAPRRSARGTTPPSRSPGSTAALDDPLLRERAADVAGRRAPRRRRGHRRGSAPAPPSRASSSPASSPRPTRRAWTPSSCAGSPPPTARSPRTPRSSRARWACRRPSGLGDAVLAIAEGTPLLLDGDAGHAAGRPAARRAGRRAGAPRARAPHGAPRRCERAGEPGAMRDGAADGGLRQPGLGRRGGDGRRAGGRGGRACCAPSSSSWTARSCPTRTSRPRRCARSPRALDGRPLIVRTLDAGADKPLPALPMPAEANPFLGVRGIRLALAAPRGPRHAAARDPARGRRASGQGDAADGGDARARSSATRALLDEARAATGIDAPLDARDHGRGPRRRADGRAAGAARRLLLDRYQRPDPVHDGRRARRRAPRRAARRPAARRPAARARDRRRRPRPTAAGSGCAASWPATPPRRCCSPASA